MLLPARNFRVPHEFVHLVDICTNAHPGSFDQYVTSFDDTSILLGFGMRERVLIFTQIIFKSFSAHDQCFVDENSFPQERILENTWKSSTSTTTAGTATAGAASAGAAIAGAATTGAAIAGAATSRAAGRAYPPRVVDTVAATTNNCK